MDNDLPLLASLPAADDVKCKEVLLPLEYGGGGGGAPGGLLEFVLLPGLSLYGLSLQLPQTNSSGLALLPAADDVTWKETLLPLEDSGGGGGGEGGAPGGFLKLDVLSKLSLHGPSL